jgi:signal transduction histidine kinase
LLSIKLASHDGTVIRIANSGTGMAADDILWFFEPFIQIENLLNRQHEGTSLGPALAHHSATLMVECWSWTSLPTPE